MTTPAHVGWLQRSATHLTTSDGMHIDVWELRHQPDDAILSDWARHFRQHYCRDGMLNALVAGTAHTRASFLTEVKFPDPKKTPGPSTRAGDFGEILLADFAEYVLGYWCPREGRYESRDNRNVPSNGCDVVGFKFVAAGTVNPNDELLLMETKAGLRSARDNRLQTAIDDSVKDLTREAMSLNAIKQRLLQTDLPAALRVQRFQNQNDRPFQRVNAASAILDDTVFNPAAIAATVAKTHPNASNLHLFVVRGVSLMDLVHRLYEVAANEA